ncbi:DUF1698 domain-containing protein [Pseudoxanthobacter sp. M-2]|uniref:DUF1698 domain-containing protein n=1 Tax=Pseudoxanthobacter sp. M-2 TaxID=3078754 RepID=UPI0038FC5AA7
MNAFINEIRDLRPVDLWRDFKSGVTEADFRSRCSPQMIWHSVDLGDVFIEGQNKISKITAREMHLANLPDLRGKSVLDIGAFGGWFSFEAERRGAKSVTAPDYYSWCFDWPKIHAWVASERAAGRAPDVYDPPADCIDTVTQPGRRAFDVTKEILQSSVQPVLSLAEDYAGGPFDVVLYLGVLYHTRNPFYSLQKVANLTGERLIVETQGLHLPAGGGRALWEFYESDNLNADKTTWWAPTAAGLVAMLKGCGFTHIEIHDGTDVLTEEQKKQTHAIRLWAQATR